MQKATIAVTVPHFFATHFAFSDEGLPYHISYLTFQGSRNVSINPLNFLISDLPFDRGDYHS